MRQVDKFKLKPTTLISTFELVYVSTEGILSRYLTLSPRLHHLK